MTLDEIKRDLKSRLSAKRFKHSEGVAETARKLARLYGEDEEKAFWAGWMHDSAKELSLSEMQKIVTDGGLHLDKDMMASRSLLHGPAGSVLAKTRYGVSDPSIGSAIYYHTTGCEHMTVMEKIIFLADYIEPSRDFPGVNKLRKLAPQDLDEACLAAYDSTLHHLLDQEAFIYPLTFLGRNDLVRTLQEKKNEKN